MKTTHEQPETHNTKQSRPNKHLPDPIRGAMLIGVTLMAFGALIYSALANTPEPVMSISHLSSNQFSITISDTVTTNYTLEWTPYLSNTNYPWKALWGISGTNTTFTSDEPSGWFRLMVGIDGDGDGIPPWLDANDSDSGIGILTITIDSPLNGETLN